MVFVFDGSLEGLLTAVFECFDRKIDNVQLETAAQHQEQLFDDSFIVHPDAVKANRVWKGLLSKLDKEWMRKLYCAYLSESSETFSHLFIFIINIFKKGAAITENYGDASVLHIAQMAKKVEREKHRMKAFVRFEKSNDGLFFCAVEPDFNVLPLIADFFKKRYADQPWLIFDTQRKYGIMYNLQTVERVEMILPSAQNILPTANNMVMEPTEHLYATLWQDYFKSTNIEARKNLKLHIQHVPKRYWRFLTEKRDAIR